MLILLFFCQNNTYFLALFNSSQLKADPIKIIAFFGLAEVLGILFTERLIRYVADSIGLVASFSFVLLINLVMRASISSTTLFIIFLVDVFCLGAIYNLVIIIQGSRCNPRLQSIALEFNLCVAQFTTLVCPILAKQPEPTPLIYNTALCILGIIVILNIPPKKTHNVDIKKQIEATFSNLSQSFGNGDSNSLANLSSILIVDKKMRN